MPKGHTNNPNGRPSGSKNKKTEQWNKFAEWFMGEGMTRLTEELATLEGKDFVKEVKDLMEYFQPKLSRTEIKAEIETTKEIDMTQYSDEQIERAINDNRETDSGEI